MPKRTIFDSVINYARTIKTLQSTLDLVTWDQETMLPPAANDHCSDQRALLASLIHKKMTAPTYLKQIEHLADDSRNNDDAHIIAKRLLRDVHMAQKLPTAFVTSFSRATSAAFDAWQQARQNDSWAIFEPHLAKLVDLVRQKAEYLGYKRHPLDALLDEHDPEITTEGVSLLFDSLKSKLIRLLTDIKNSPQYGQPKTQFPSTHAEQMAICKEVISFIGFDWQRGRLDTSEHPFSIGLHPTDIRITVRHSSPNLLDQIMSGLHEAGHGLYEMGLPRQWFGTPLAEAISCSIHESQSLLWENIIGRSRAFVSHLFSILRTHYPTTCPFTSKEALYQQLNRVECSLIRTQADEVTYPLHIIMRFEIEKELLTGALSVHDLPQRWSEGMQTMLGCQPPSDKLGCLQDVHWSLGSFGYFPTYTLGSLYAVSFFEAMKQALPNLESLVSQGELAPIRSWLHEHVWSQGRRFLSHELVTRALGREPSEDDYINYLRAKYCS